MKRFEKKQSKISLDVGGGTGEHLKHFSLDFQCTRIDRDMTKTAKSKGPNAKLKVGNMKTSYYKRSST